MKRIILAAAFLLLASAGRAQAQGFASATSTTPSFSSIGGGHIARSWPSTLPKRYGVATQKNNGSFVPSTFLTYPDAVKLGESDPQPAPDAVKLGEPDPQPATSNLGEIARLARERKNAETDKTRVVFERDGNGKILPNRAEPQLGTGISHSDSAGHGRN
jgi:hypothetical protein